MSFYLLYTRTKTIKNQNNSRPSMLKARINIKMCPKSRNFPDTFSYILNWPIVSLRLFVKDFSSSTFETILSIACSNWISAKRMKWREVNDWMGKKNRYVRKCISFRKTEHPFSLMSVLFQFNFHSPHNASRRYSRMSCRDRLLHLGLDMFRP